MPSVSTCSIPLELTRDEDRTRARLRGDRAFVRVRPGVYAPSTAWAQAAPWERYRARVEAVALTWSDPVFALESAASLCALPVFGEPRLVHLYDPDASASRTIGDVMVHASVDPRPTTWLGGFAATTAAATAVDLGRVLPPAFALAVWDAAWRIHGAEPSWLTVVAAEQASRRGTRQLAWLAERATDKSESSGESVSRAAIEWLGFDPPELQVWFHTDGYDDRVDMYWRGARLIGESDGYGKYLAATSADTVGILRRERGRAARLRSTGNRLAQWDWHQTVAGEPLGRILSQAGLPTVRTPQHHLLRTLRANTRSLAR